MPDSAIPAAFEAIDGLRRVHRELLEALAAAGGKAPDKAFCERVGAFREQIRQTGSLLSTPDERQEAQSVINFWLTILFNAGEQPRSILLAAFDHDAARARSERRAPYRGLEPFQIEDRSVFLGRQRAMRDLLDRMATRRLIAVTGPSGSGKSSIVRAGLIPALRDGIYPRSETWRVLAPMVPGADPIAALEALLSQEGLSPARIATPDDLTKALDSSGGVVMLSVDQFEEAFTLTPGGPKRSLFMAALQHAATSRRHPHVMLLTMRSEFDTAIEEDQDFAREFREGRVRIGPLDSLELRTVIEQPAAQMGVQFEPGLVDELVRRAENEPAGLPLLQFTLLELWKLRNRDQITFDVYEGLGGAPRKILAQRADEVFDNFQEPSDRRLMQAIFIELVQIASGLEPVSRRASRAELDRFGNRDAVNRVLDICVAGGLLRVNPRDPIVPGSQVEVAHEALIRNWDQYVTWIQEALAGSRWRGLLRERARGWKANRESLLGELSLAEADRFTDLEPLEVEYVEASRKDVRRKQRRTKLFVTGAVVGFGIAMALMVLTAGLYAYARGQQEVAQKQEQAAVYQKAVADAARREAAINERAAAEQMALATQAREEAAEAERRASVAAARVRAAQDALADARARLQTALSQADSEDRRLADLRGMSATQVELIRQQKVDLEALERQRDQLQEDLKTANLERDQANSLSATKTREALLAEQRAAQTRLEIERVAALGRPAIAFENGRLGRLPTAWLNLEVSRSRLEDNARSVGRLTIRGPDGAFGLGGATGFRVGRTQVITMLASENQRPGELLVDFRDRPDGRLDEAFRVVRITRPSRGNGVGLAVLDLEPTNAAGRPLPAAMALSSINEQLEPGRILATIGYPQRDTRVSSVYAEAVLGSDFGVKRLSPGFLLGQRTGRESGLEYDMTTLGGSGGGPVIDVMSGVVIGVHTGGLPSTSAGVNTKQGLPIDAVFLRELQAILK